MIDLPFFFFLKNTCHLKNSLNMFLLDTPLHSAGIGECPGDRCHHHTGEEGAPQYKPYRDRQGVGDERAYQELAKEHTAPDGRNHTMRATNARGSMLPVPVEGLDSCHIVPCNHLPDDIEHERSGEQEERDKAGQS